MTFPYRIISDEDSERMPAELAFDSTEASESADATERAPGDQPPCCYRLEQHPLSRLEALHRQPSRLQQWLAILAIALLLYLASWNMSRVVPGPSSSLTHTTTNALPADDIDMGVDDANKMPAQLDIVD